MLLTPIPKSVLLDTIILKKYVKRDGQIFYEDDKEITNVRIQKDYKTNYEDGAVVRTNENILFVDKINSKPFDVDDYQIEGIVIFSGDEYRIKNVEVIDGINSVHHLEVTLI